MIVDWDKLEALTRSAVMMCEDDRITVYKTIRGTLLVVEELEDGLYRVTEVLMNQ